MTLLKFAAAAAGAGIIPIGVGEGLLQNRHYFLRFTAAPNQPGHQLHREIDVLKE
jgi:hypothetical protein